MKDYKALSRREFDRQARSVWGRVGYNSQHYGALIAALGPIQPRAVLDLGCGGGALLERMSEALPDVALSGLDLSPNMVDVASARLGVRARIVQGDAEAMPFEDGAFDAIICNESFHHYPHPDAALREMARVLKPSGTLLLCDLLLGDRMRMFANWLFRRIPTGDVRAYSESETLALLAAAGFVEPRYARISGNAFLCIAKRG